MSIAETAAALSAGARRAMELASTHGVMHAFPATAVLEELCEAGLIGPRGGLTVRGQCVAQHVKDEQLDRAFGGGA